MNQRKRLFTIFTLIFSVGFTCQVLAQEETSEADFIKTRSYIGFMGNSATLDQWGNFIGTQFLQSPSTVTSTNPVSIFSNPEQDIIPSIGRNFGWGAMLGHREGPWAAEVSFWRSDHTATWVNSSSVTFNTPASLQSIDLTLKRYFFTELPTQPFVNLGLSFPWLWIQQGSSLLSGTSTTVLTTDNETFSGLGFTLGAGLEIYLDNNFSVLGGVFQRWTGFNQVGGAARTTNNLNNLYLDNLNGSSVNSIEGDGLNLYVGATVGVQ